VKRFFIGALEVFRMKGVGGMEKRCAHFVDNADFGVYSWNYESSN